MSILKVKFKYEIPDHQKESTLKTIMEPYQNYTTVVDDFIFIYNGNNDDIFIDILRHLIMEHDMEILQVITPSGSRVNLKWIREMM